MWGPEYGDEREYLRTYILQLRRKFEEDPAQPIYLKTVNYLGYVFLDTVEKTAPLSEEDKSFPAKQVAGQ